MKFLVVGAGALGGYFGGRLLEAGHDATFLLRPRRAAQIKAHGLSIKSRFGDAHLPSPPFLLAQDISTPFDVIIVACKAYDLEQTMESFEPAVGSDTVILPLLNGMRHIDQLATRFGRQHVLGGQCLISAALDADGAVQHLNDVHALAFGEQDGSRSDRVQEIEKIFSTAKFTSRASPEILQEMWEKWIFIASAAGITCLMRAAIGDIVNAGATDLGIALLEEGRAIAGTNGIVVRQNALDRSKAILAAAGSLVTASMLKDIERGAPTEAEHIFGDLLRRDGNGNSPMLRIAYAHLKAYESRRLRESAAGGT